MGVLIYGRDLDVLELFLCLNCGYDVLGLTLDVWFGFMSLAVLVIFFGRVLYSLAESCIVAVCNYCL